MPFKYIYLNSKLQLYATKDATDQLRNIHNISIKILSREVQDSIVTVTAQATLRSGSCDESIGAASLTYVAKDGKEYEYRGDAKANVFMKAETKAKRRVTLSIVGLGMLDETEVEDLPDTQKKYVDQPELPANNTKNDPSNQQTNQQARQQNKPKEPEQPAEPVSIKFDIKQKAERENKGRKFYYLAILEKDAGEVRNVYVLAPADVEAINKGLENGILSFSGMLKAAKDKLFLEQLQPLEEPALGSVEQKAS